MGGIISPGLKGAIARIEKFASSARGKVAKKLAPKLDARIQAQFDNGTDAYGKPWAPLLPQTVRRKGGNAQINVRTGETGASSYALATGNRVVITYGGAAIHLQNGDPGKNRVPRPIAPTGTIPKTWSQDAKDAADEVAKEASR